MPACIHCNDFLISTEAYKTHLMKRRLEGGHGVGELEADWIINGNPPKLKGPPMAKAREKR